MPVAEDLAPLSRERRLALIRDGCDEAGVFEVFVTIADGDVDEDGAVEYADEAYLAMRAAGATPDHIYVVIYY